MGRALIVSAGASSNEYISARLTELGYARPLIVPSAAEARRRMLESDFELIVVNAPLPDEFGHELCADAVEKTDAGVAMEKADTGLWSGFVAGLAEGELYKYRIHGADGSVVLHADPYAFSTELRPGTASRLAALDFSFDDSAWMARRDKCRNLPLNIYELHAGSWKHKPNGGMADGSDGWYDYEELARELIPWLLDHRFTHV